MSRALIVNADDLGRSEGVNRGIFEAYDEGVVTSASLMVRAPAAPHAAALARERPALSVGLHVDLGEWTHRGGAWEPVYVVVPKGDEESLRDEVESQHERFRALMGRDPTHLDSHQHVHRYEPVRSLLITLASSLDVPLREEDGARRYCGDFYGQAATGEPLPDAITVDALIRLFRALPPGVTELGCHPGDDPELDSSYRLERRREVETLCDPRVRAALAAERIELRSFADIGQRHG